jgi:VWA / Hh  protein intein-like
LQVNTTYRDATTALIVELGEQEISIERPVTVTDHQICIEVERERVRVQAMEDMVAARVAAEQGAMREAVEILEGRWEALGRSEVAMGGDLSCKQLQVELREMGSRMSTRKKYETSGRAFTLAGLSAHTRQRATTRSSMRRSKHLDELVCGASGSFSYQTPAMADMVRKSQSSLKPESSNVQGDH